MISTKRLATYYLNYPDGFSILRDLFEYDTPPRTLSLRERLRHLERFADLRVTLIQNWIDNWNTERLDPSYSTPGNPGDGIGPDIKDRSISGKSGTFSKRSFRRIAAVLMAIKDISHFDEPYAILWEGEESLSRIPLNNTPVANRNVSDDGDPKNTFFPDQLEAWTKNEFEVFGGMGSAEEWWRRKKNKPGSYDFVMKEIISLLYVFRDDRDLLTDEACFQLVDRGFRPFLKEKFGKHLTYTIPIPGWLIALPGGALSILAAIAVAGGLIAGLIAVLIAAFGMSVTIAFLVAAVRGSLNFPETENHVLLAYSSIYLARQWVKQNPRGDSRLEQPPYSNIASAELDGDIEDLLLQASGRVLHNGFFETNARPYRAFTCHPLIILYSFAANPNISAGSGNALNFAWTSFAFRSFHQRSYSPHRRNNNKAADPSIYGTGNTLMAAPFFNPPHPEGQVVDEEFWEDLKGGNPDGFTMWTMLHNYRPHEIITDFAIKQTLFETPQQEATLHHGYWARMQARYTKDHYKKGDQPHYFEEGGDTFQAGSKIKSTPEVCFVQKDFMNAGGGRFDRYKVRFDDLVSSFRDSPEGTHEYDFIARPQVAFVENTYQEFKITGDHEDEKNDEKKTWLKNMDRLESMKDEVMFMLGEKGYLKNPHGFWLADNSGIYKGFTYGYYKERNNKDRHLDYPMFVPQSWSDFRYQEDGKISFENSGSSRVKFRFYDLEVNGEPGPYVVIARVSKSKNRRRYRSYARGFWELVSRTRFESAKDLKNWVLQHNPDAQFSDDIDGENRFYIYTMTTGESLQLNHLLGHDKEANPIRNIWADGMIPLVDDPLNLSEFGINHDNPLAMPLLEVREVDAESKFPEKNIIYAIAEGDGRLRVSNPFMNYELTFDSQNYKNPSKNGNPIT